MSLRSHIRIDTLALRHNARQIIAWAEDRTVIAVVKADNYGLGVERCAPVFREEGIRCFAVANIHEALRVHAVVPDARLIILGEVLAEERERVAAIGAEPCLSRLEDAKAFARLGTPERPIAVHLFVDTGMGRMGCIPEEAEELYQAIVGTPHLRLAGIGSHYPEATEAEFSANQERLFADILQRCPQRPDDCLIHLANSSGLRHRPGEGSNAVRIGLLLSGCTSDLMDRALLQPVVSWHSCIILLKELPAGHNVSYGLTHFLKRDTLVAVVPVGYADGYPRALSGKSEVLIHGERCPVLGRITMDYMIVDVSQLTRPQHGDEVILLGRQGHEHVRCEELAEWADTIPYEILCSLNKRFREK